jgi:hypothetical protein
MGDGEKRVRTVTALVNTVVAIAPFAFVAVIALPVTCVCEGLAYVAEHTCLYSLLWIVLTHEHMRRCRRFSERSKWSPVSLASKDMRMLIV